MFLKTKPRIPKFLKTNLTDEMQDKHIGTKEKTDKKRGKERAFEINERVFIRSVRGAIINWLSGVIIKIIPPSSVTYLVGVDGRQRFVHDDHLKTHDTRGGRSFVTKPSSKKNN